MAIGIAIAVKRQIVNVIWINFARGRILTVTTAIMETRKPNEV